MKTLVGREKEIEKLNEYVNSGRAEFVALYGRRRVGKTFLINQVFKKRLAFSVTGVLGGGPDEQMEAFVDALETYSGEAVKRPKTWMQAFILLKKYLTHRCSSLKHCIIFIDELPSFDTQRSGFVRALGYFWNSWASLQDKVTLIVCGSATSWMIRNVVDDKGGLHDRITHEMHLRPFSLYEVEVYLKSRGFVWNRLSVLQAYMVFGGIPYYLSLLQNNESFVQNIDRLFFGEDEEMRREYRRLYQTLFKSPEGYMAIISLLATNHSGFTRKEIAERLGEISGGKLSSKLEDLVNCDIIRRYNVRKKKISTTSAVYQLTDFYSLFYQSFIGKAETEKNYWSNHLNTSEVNAWLGFAFERVCAAHVEQIKHALHIDRISTKHYSWRSSDLQNRAQVDLLIERADDIVNLCEIKYSDGKYLISKSEEEKIRNRMTAFKRETGLKSAVWITFVSAYGLTPNSHSDIVVENIVMDDLFVCV